MDLRIRFINIQICLSSFVFILITHASILGQLNVHGLDIGVQHQRSSEHFSSLQGLSHSTSFLWDSISPLDEINLPNSSDAFPYISYDGKRLYFNRGSYDFAMAERTTIDDTFRIVQYLGFNNALTNYSCWLREKVAGSP